MVNSPPVTPTTPLTPVSPYSSDVVSPAPSLCYSIDEINVESSVLNVKTPEQLARRKKNNLASQKSRLKKKMKFHEMQQQIAQLEKENQLLMRMIESLRVSWEQYRKVFLKAALHEADPTGCQVGLASLLPRLRRTLAVQQTMCPESWPAVWTHRVPITIADILTCRNAFDRHNNASVPTPHVYSVG